MDKMPIRNISDMKSDSSFLAIDILKGYIELYCYRKNHFLMSWFDKGYESTLFRLHDFDRFMYDGVGFQVLKFLRTKKDFLFWNFVLLDLDGYEKMIS